METQAGKPMPRRILQFASREQSLPGNDVARSSINIYGAIFAGELRIRSIPAPEQAVWSERPCDNPLSNRIGTGTSGGVGAVRIRHAIVLRAVYRYFVRGSPSVIPLAVGSDARTWISSVFNIWRREEDDLASVNGVVRVRTSLVSDGAQRVK
jgi:hypothetical protein